MRHEYLSNDNKKWMIVEKDNHGSLYSVMIIGKRLQIEVDGYTICVHQQSGLHGSSRINLATGTQAKQIWTEMIEMLLLSESQ